MFTSKEETFHSMANTSGKWETVVNKKKSHVTKSDVKRAQQKFIDGENVPKIESKGQQSAIFMYIYIYYIFTGDLTQATSFSVVINANQKWPTFIYLFTKKSCECHEKLHFPS